jgi:hypothetical protein
MRNLMALLFLIGTLGCTPTPKYKIVEASFKNSSAHDLNWVTMEWAGPAFEAGVLPAGKSATYLDLNWPNVSTGTITFIDFKTKHPYRIAVSFKSISEQIQSGNCRAITIRILDYDKAVVVVGSP